jgi:proteasome accessory factor A
MPMLVARQILTGAGKVGAELGHSATYQVSQRADFFEEEVGLETTLKRPIVNTRDEPHCDPTKYRRLHVIVGDANMSEVATFLKVGTTAIILSMIEDGVFPERLLIQDPVPSIRKIGHDTSLQQTVLMADDRQLSALQIQYELLDSATRYLEKYGFEAVGEESGRDVLSRWEYVLFGLQSDPLSVGTIVDWVAKKRIVDGFAERHQLESNDAKLKVIDLQYHDMRVEKCLALKADLEVLCKSQDVLKAMVHPPEDTRAFFRGTALQRWPHHVIAANWDSVVFDIENQGLKRVPMPEPLRGSKLLVGEILANSKTPSEFIDKIDASF